MLVAVIIVVQGERGFMMTSLVVLLKTDSTIWQKYSLYNFENCILIFLFVALPD